MSNVQFEDTQVVRTHRKQRSLLSGVVISLGLAKDEKSAQIVLLVFVVLLLVVSLFFVFSGKTNTPVEDFTIAPNETVGSPQGLPPQ